MLEARRKARQAEQEEALMLELERRKREEEARRLQIQLICESDPSLRDLQAKLQVSCWPAWSSFAPGPCAIVAPTPILTYHHRHHHHRHHNAS